MQELSKRELELQSLIKSDEELKKAAKRQKIFKVIRLIVIYLL